MALVIVSLVGFIGAARTDIFDSINVGGTATFTGTIGFTGTTIEFSPSTSFAVYTPTIYLGYDAGARMNVAVSDTTGNVAITHTGSTKNLSWTTAGATTFTFGSFLIDGSTVVLDNGATLDNTGSATELLIQETNVKLSGAVQMEAGAVTVGTSGVSFDTTFYSDTAGKTLVWGDTEFLDLTVAAGDEAFKISNGNFVLSQVTAAADRNSPWIDLVGYDHDTTEEIDMGWRVEVTGAADYKMSLYEDGLNTEVASFDESGNLQIDGSLTAGSITGYAIGVDVQAYDAELAALAGLTFADDQIILGTGAGTIAMASCTVFAQSILDDANEATFKATVNLEIGADVQAYDANLTTWAGISPSVNVQSFSAAADYSTMRTLLGVAVGSDVLAYSADLATVATAAGTATNEGMVFCTTFKLDYGQTASQTVGIVPANAYVMDLEVVVTTLFNGGGTDTLDIGISGGAADGYANDLDLSTAGYITSGVVFSALGSVGGADRTITCLYVDQNSDATTGSALVNVYWRMGTVGD
jgi:hypothetical protein